MDGPDWLWDFWTFLSHSPVHFEKVKVCAPYLDPTVVDPLHPDPMARICSPPQCAHPPCLDVDLAV
jgi:hypothetical protein